MRKTVFSILLVLSAAVFAFGQLQEYAWSILLETPGSDENPNALFELGNGDLVVFGYSRSSMYVNSNSLMLKFNAQGDTTFSLPFAGKAFGKVIGISDERFLAFQWSIADTALYAYKISRAGEILWEKKLTQAIWKGLYANFNISGDGNGNFEVLAVRTDSSGSHVIVDLRVDSLLDSLGARNSVIDTVYDYTPVLRGKVNGGYIVSAQIRLSSYGFSHFKHDIMKIDSMGNRVWTVKLLPTTFSSQSLLSYGLAWLEVLPSGNVSVLLSTSPTGGTHPMETEWLIISSAGAIVRQKLLGTNILYSNAVRVANGEHLFIGNNSSQQARYLLKTDSLGNSIELKQTVPFDFKFYNMRTLLARDSGLVFADQTDYPDPSLYDQAKQDIVLSKVGRDAIAVESKPAATAFSPLRASPNPFRSMTTLRFPASLSGACVMVYDIAGKNVKSAGNVKTGTLALDFSGLGNGLYVVKVKSGGRQYQKVITLLK